MNNCIDAGHEGCPCALAESGHCLVCGRMNGATCDTCSWQGVCIYSLYAQNGRRPAETRGGRPMKIVGRKRYNPAFTVFVLEADRGFCQKAAEAGTYVFVRGGYGNSWFDMPVSVLKSEPEKERFHLGICGCGPKSASILEQEEMLFVRGIYRNGLTGIGTLHAYPEQTLVFGKGIAIAPLRNFLDGGERYTRYLKNMKLYADLEKTGFDFFRDYFGDLPVEAIEICDFSQTDFRRFFTGKEANTFALASPYYVEQIRDSSGDAGAFVCPTEGNFCCGEGICGACTENDAYGRTVRRCKAAK